MIRHHRLTAGMLAALFLFLFQVPGFAVNPYDENGAAVSVTGGTSPSSKPVPTVWDGKGTLQLYLLNTYGFRATEGSQEWRANELAIIAQLLSELPPEFVKACRGFNREKVHPSNSRALGWVKFDDRIVNLTDKGSQDKRLDGVILHEMTHCLQAKDSRLADKWEEEFWGWFSPKTPSVNEYGNSSVIEDMAESVRMYYESGAYFREKDPKRYDFVKTHIMGGKEFKSDPTRW